MHVSFFVECYLLDEKLYHYCILHYALDFKYGDHSLFTGVSVTNYAN